MPCALVRLAATCAAAAAAELVDVRTGNECRAFQRAQHQALRRACAQISTRMVLSSPSVSALSVLAPEFLLVEAQPRHTVGIARQLSSVARGSDGLAPASGPSSMHAVFEGVENFRHFYTASSSIAPPNPPPMH